MFQIKGQNCNTGGNILEFNSRNFVRFVVMSDVVGCYTMYLVDMYRPFRRTCYLHLQGERGQQRMMFPCSKLRINYKVIQSQNINREDKLLLLKYSLFTSKQ
jgi:hypothetical protein